MNNWRVKLWFARLGWKSDWFQSTDHWSPPPNLLLLEFDRSILMETTIALFVSIDLLPPVLGPNSFRFVSLRCVERGIFSSFLFLRLVSVSLFAAAVATGLLLSRSSVKYHLHRRHRHHSHTMMMFFFFFFFFLWRKGGKDGGGSVQLSSLPRDISRSEPNRMRSRVPLSSSFLPSSALVYSLLKCLSASV